jgi:hypothetical protein
MADQRYATETLLEVERGKKKRVRPKKKWLEAGTTDLRKLGLTDWKRHKIENVLWLLINESVCFNHALFSHHDTLLSCQPNLVIVGWPN